MKILYIYPHPDDESFGPAHVMHKQVRDGHEVTLLTLTKGGATKQRHKYGKTIDEMGQIRFEEMLEVQKVLGLKNMAVFDLPDSGLKELDPREIEDIVRRVITKAEPNVIVSYPVHGISGFHDHLICHAVVKRVFVEMVEEVEYLKRLAFVTITKEHAEKVTFFKLGHSTEEEIDCVVTVEDEDIDANIKSLDCYVTFKETIDNTGIKDMILHESCFEIYNENFTPPITDLFDKI